MDELVREKGEKAQDREAQLKWAECLIPFFLILTLE